MTPSKAYESGLARDAGHDMMCIAFRDKTYLRVKKVLKDWEWKSVVEHRVGRGFADVAYIGRQKIEFGWKLICLAFEMKPVIGQAGALVRQIRALEGEMEGGVYRYAAAFPVVYEDDKCLAPLLAMYERPIFIVNRYDNSVTCRVGEDGNIPWSAITDQLWVHPHKQLV